MMSQPDSNASAPRLAPPRKNARRAGSGISFAASLISSLGSTPGGFLRKRAITSSSTTRHHGAQALRHRERHHDVHHQERRDRAHGEEMHVPRRVITAEHRGEL